MKKVLLLISITVTLICGSSLPSTFNVRAEKDDKTKFRKAERRVPNQFVVMFKPHVRAKEVAKYARKLAKDNNGSLLSVFEFVKGFALEMTEKDAIKLSNDNDVEFVEENGLISVAQSSCANSSAFAPGHYGVDRLDQRYLPRDGNYCPTRTGRGANIFVLDSGIWPHIKTSRTLTEQAALAYSAM